MVQKISGQTFTNILNLSCYLDLERSNLIFQQDTLAYDAVLSNEVWLQIAYFDYISPHCDLDIEHSEPIFLYGTLVYDVA